MLWIDRLCTSCAAVFALVLLGGAASATAQAAEPISGTLSQPGYTVIALADSGLADTDLAANGAFSLNPPATEVTLHLRAPNGTYVGPVVLKENGNSVESAATLLKREERVLRKAKRKLKKVRRWTKKAKRRARKARKHARRARSKKAKRQMRKARKRVRKARRRLKRARKRVKKVRRRVKAARTTLSSAQERARGVEAILGVKAGAKLGNVMVDPAAGYAKATLTEQQWKQWVNEGRRATAVSGIPIGAGNFGRVQVSTLNGVPGDLDRDGISNRFDIDDDGDLILDDIDTTPEGGAGAASVSQAQQGGESFFAFTNLVLEGNLKAGDPYPSPVVNANAGNLSFAQIESGLRADGSLHITAPLRYASGEIDCGELVYCSAGGTGWRDRTGDPGNLDPAPEPFPACCDPDGNGFGSLGTVAQEPSVGILLQTRAGANQIRGGDVLIMQGTTQDGKHQELASILETVFVTPPAIASYTDELGVTHNVSYPYTDANLPVVDGPDPGTDVSVTLNFWRPQRRPIPDELPPGSGDWIDIGGLQYNAGAPMGGGDFCSEGTYAESDPNLTLKMGTAIGGSGPIQVPVLLDSALDRVANPANTFSYTLNLSQCLATWGFTFNPGERALFGFGAAFPPLDSHPLNKVMSLFAFQNQT